MKMFRCVACFFVAAVTVLGCNGVSKRSLSGNDDIRGQLKALVAADKYSEVLAVCDEQLKSAPSNAELWAYRGMAEFYSGKPEVAKADLLHAISLNPKAFWYHRELGCIYLDAGKNDEALQSLTEALKLAPNSEAKAPVHGLMASVLLSLNEPDKAIYEVGEALKNGPVRPWIYQTRALAYSDLWQDKEALVDATKCIELDDKSASAYGLRAEIYLYLGDCANASADAQKALSLDKNYWRAKDTLVLIDLTEGRDKEALKSADWLIENYPKSVSSYLAKAYCFLAMNDLERARQMVDKALEMNGQDTLAIETAIVVASKRGDRLSTEKLLDRLPKKFTGGTQYSRSRAMALLFLKQYGEAIAYCSSIISREKTCPFLLRVRSEAYRRLGKDELAVVDMKNAVAQCYVKKSVLERYLTAASKY